ncbi:DUF2946 family protein [Bradyrhizobium sp.]|uniref:DUF2946 family protein n=1 Tax=Bradyrhizobium sp. TaxID=376 RepID=UPI003C72DC17
MRRRLQNFLPVVMVALLVQIVAPIGVTWAASIAASDPLRAAPICSGGAASSTGQADRNVQHRAHDGCCPVCSVLHTGAPLDVPRIAEIIGFDLQPGRVVWRDFTQDLSRSRTGSHAQARAPPLSM